MAQGALKEVTMRIPFILLVIVISSSISLAADVIHLKSGNTIEGEVVKEDNDEVRVRVGGGEAVFPRTKIGFIGHGAPTASSSKNNFSAPISRATEYGSPATITEHITRALEYRSQGDYQNALKEMEQASHLQFPSVGYDNVWRMIIEFLLAAAVLWLAVTILKGRPPLGRVILCECIWEGIARMPGLLWMVLPLLSPVDLIGMALMSVVIPLIAFPVCLLLILFLFIRMFALGFWRAVLVFLLSRVIGLGTAYLLGWR